mmetsp:Transcript_25164/g.87801  ORF Transcript_25164/g.87801 Transcript_25164/m.87801 type:complete len:382 (+) Transcript_25164:172-1317(+)
MPKLATRRLPRRLSASRQAASGLDATSSSCLHDHGRQLAARAERCVVTLQELLAEHARAVADEDDAEDGEGRERVLDERRADGGADGVHHAMKNNDDHPHLGAADTGSVDAVLLARQRDAEQVKQHDDEEERVDSDGHPRRREAGRAHADDEPEPDAEQVRHDVHEEAVVRAREVAVARAVPVQAVAVPVERQAEGAEVDPRLVVRVEEDDAEAGERHAEDADSRQVVGRHPRRQTAHEPVEQLLLVHVHEGPVLTHRRLLLLRVVRGRGGRRLRRGRSSSCHCLRGRCGVGQGLASRERRRAHHRVRTLTIAVRRATNAAVRAHVAAVRGRGHVGTRGDGACGRCHIERRHVARHGRRSRHLCDVCETDRLHPARRNVTT